MRRFAAIPVIACLLLVVSGCGRHKDGRGKVAYVTNGVASFWVIAEAGAQQGAEEADVDVEVLMPVQGIGDQKRMIEDLITKGVDGIAVSPIDPVNQTEFLNDIAEHAILITHDSDAPEANRRCYIGVDNYQAGRQCGELVTEALPQGGKVAIFIGRLEQDNARRRRQGVIDEILQRSYDPNRFDLPGADLKDGKWHIVPTYTDQFDHAVGKANAEDAMSQHPDLAGMVGLFAYNPPLILEALKQADKLDQIKVIGFDEADETLQGIKDGTVHGTVVQNPFEYGRRSVLVLAGLLRGQSLDQLGVPENGFLEIPERQIRPDNVDEFWAELRKDMGQ